MNETQIDELQRADEIRLLRLQVDALQKQVDDLQETVIKLITPVQRPPKEYRELAYSKRGKLVGFYTTDLTTGIQSPIE